MRITILWAAKGKYRKRCMTFGLRRTKTVIGNHDQRENLPKFTTVCKAMSLRMRDGSCKKKQKKQTSFF